MQIPERYELEYIFEQEAKLIDDEVPWYYNGVSFSLTRQDETLDFYISPSTGSGGITIKSKGNVIVTLDLENMKELTLRNERDQEKLVIVFDDECSLLPLVLTT